MEPPSSALEKLLLVWKQVGNVSSLTFGECKSALEFLDNEAVDRLFAENENCKKFCERTHHGEGVGYVVGSLIQKKITELQKQKEHLVPPFRPHFESVWSSLNQLVIDSFNQFNSLGNSADYAHFKELFNSIYTNHSRLPPWIFVCASSGTGKTQMAFSLAKNRLYFIIEPKSADSQAIYKPFEAISKKLHDLISLDIGHLKAMPNNSSIEPAELATSKYIRGNTQSIAATFILLLIKNILSMSSVNWLESEARISFGQEEIEANTLEQLRDEIVSLFPNHIDRPVVFFDECVGTSDIAHIYYMRTVLRTIGLISIFMSANANAVDILEKFDFSRIARQSALYAFVVNRLPSMNIRKFNEMHMELAELIENANIQKSRKVEKLKVLDLMFKILENERPLFIILASDYLRNFFCNDSNVHIDIEKLCRTIREYFIYAKAINTTAKGIDYTKSQINLMMTDEWRLYEKPQCLTVPINRHIAYLKRPTNLYHNESQIPDHPNYFPIYGSETIDFEYTMKDNDGNVKFKVFRPISVMPLFNIEPLACLVFSGSMDDMNTFVEVIMDDIVQISALKAIHQCVQKVTFTFTSILCGRQLEFICGMAAVASSRASNGSFFKFLERFTYHLSFNPHMRQLDDSELSDEWRRRLQVEEFPVPLLAPVRSEWNESMKEMLRIYYGNKFHYSEEVCEKLSGGICELSANQKPYNVYFQDGKGKDAITIDCKLYHESLSISNLKEMFKTLTSSGCRIGFVVATRFAATLEKISHKSFPSNYSIYSLIPVKDDILKLKKHFPVDAEPLIEMPLLEEHPLAVKTAMEEDVPDEKRKGKKYFRLKKKRRVGSSAKKKPSSKEPCLFILISLMELHQSTENA